MRKSSRKIISALSQDPIFYHGKKDYDIDKFYQRMLDRDIYLHISEISALTLGICFSGVSILNIDEGANRLSKSINNLLAVDSIIFITSYLVCYWIVMVMTKSDRNLHQIKNIGIAIFLIGMIFMAIICGCVVFQSDYLLKS